MSDNTQKVQDAMHDVANDIEDAAHDVKNKVKDAAHDAKNKAKDVIDLSLERLEIHERMRAPQHLPLCQ